MCKLKDSCVVCRGPLEVERAGEVSQSHVVLLEDRLDFFYSADAEERGNIPHSSVSLSDVESYQRTDAGVSIKLKMETPALQLRGVLPGGTWATSLIPLLERRFASMCNEHWTDESLRTKAQRKKSRRFSKDDRRTEGNDVLPTAPVVHQGPLDIIKSNKIKTRYFVLFHDHMEYFASKEEFREQRDPHGTMLLQDVQSVEVNSLGMNELLVGLGDRQFQLRACDSKEAERWGGAWNTALSTCGAMVKVHIASDTTCSTSSGGESQSQPTPPAPRRSVRQDEDVEDEGDGYEEDEATTWEPTGLCQHDSKTEIEEVCLSEPEKQEPARPALVVPARANVMREGYLGVGWRHKNRMEQRYVVLLGDRLEYYEDSAARSRGANPRARIMLCDLKHLELGDANVSVHMVDRILELQIGGSSSEEWRASFEDAFQAAVRPPAPASANMSLPVAASATPTDARQRSPQRAPSSHTPRAAASPTAIPRPSTARSVSRGRHAVQERVPSAIPQPATVISLHEGALRLRGANSSEPRYAVLHARRLELFRTREEWLNGVSPIDCILFGSLCRFQLVDSGFELQGENASHFLVAVGPRELRGWKCALEQVQNDVVLSGLHAGVQHASASATGSSKLAARGNTPRRHSSPVVSGPRAAAGRTPPRRQSAPTVFHDISQGDTRTGTVVPQRSVAATTRSISPRPTRPITPARTTRSITPKRQPSSSCSTTPRRQASPTSSLQSSGRPMSARTLPCSVSFDKDSAFTTPPAKSMQHSACRTASPDRGLSRRALATASCSPGGAQAAVQAAVQAARRVCSATSRGRDSTTTSQLAMTHSEVQRPGADIECRDHEDDDFDNFPIVEEEIPSTSVKTSVPTTSRRWRCGDRLSASGKH